MRAGRLYARNHGRGAQAVQASIPARPSARRDHQGMHASPDESVNGKGGVAWQIVSGHMRLLETRQFKELSKSWAGPRTTSISRGAMIRHLNPGRALRFSRPRRAHRGADVYFIREGDDFLIQMNERAAAASSQRAISPDARTGPGRDEGSRELCSASGILRHSADEEYQSASTPFSASASIRRRQQIF